jgi:proline-specific peptidase
MSPGYNGGRSKDVSSTTSASEGFVPFREFRTWYRIVGGLDQPAPGRFPLLVLHGGPGASHNYLDPLAALAQRGRPVVFYDQLGSGNSDRPDDPTLWNIDLFLEEVATVRRELGLERVHLLGQSWGGMLALSYALMQPVGLLSLVLASATASMPLHIAEVNKLREQLPPEVKEVLSHHEEAGTTDDPAYEEATMAFYARHICRLDPWPEYLLEALEQINYQVYQTMWGADELHITGNLKDWDVSPRLGEIRVPTLLLSGRYDEFTPAEQEVLRDGIPGSEWVLFEESSHLPHVEETERFLEVVEGFLSRVERQLTPGA